VVRKISFFELTKTLKKVLEKLRLFVAVDDVTVSSWFLSHCEFWLLTGNLENQGGILVPYATAITRELVFHSAHLRYCYPKFHFDRAGVVLTAIAVIAPVSSISMHTI